MCFDIWVLGASSKLKLSRAPHSMAQPIPLVASSMAEMMVDGVSRMNIPYRVMFRDHTKAQGCAMLDIVDNEWVDG